MTQTINQRISTLLIIIFLVVIFLSCRLFYWQVVQSDELTASAFSQRFSEEIIEGARGEILSHDGYSLVTNQPSFLLYAYKPQINRTALEIANTLAPILTDKQPTDATEAAKPLDQRISETRADLINKLSQQNKNWIPLKKYVSKTTKDEIDSLKIVGLGFDETEQRYYPEGSMSAHLIGFVSHDDQGIRRGYFGLEGFYDLELKGRTGKVLEEKDAHGKPIVIGQFNQTLGRPGRNLQLHLDRSLQILVEDRLETGLQKYQASSGEIIIMDPYTGGVLAMAALPSYDPRNITAYDQSTYANPVISHSYEPGSTFKVLVMAMGIETGVITPQTRCDSTCNGPVGIGKYTIKTWNNQYLPGLNMTQVLMKSDNTGMIFTANRLGKEQFVDYLHKFGIGEKTGIDLQEEQVPSLKTKWGDIDLATASFGQGIAVTGMQMVKAVAAIANGGEMITPRIVDQVHLDTAINLKPHVEGRVISASTAQQVKEMMVQSAHQGESQWAVLRDYKVAGKTGTAQIPIAGQYDEDKTIASFIGFAPADNPKFVMLVKLTEPQSSIWASETAAPLWYQLAREVLQYYSIPPQK